MTQIDVFDPPMCCSSGVCGPQVDPLLAAFAADVDWLGTQGVTVTLAEGSVSVRPATGNEDWKELLEPGQQLTVDVAHPRGRRSEVDAARVTAWCRCWAWLMISPLWGKQSTGWTPSTRRGS